MAKKVSSLEDGETEALRSMGICAPDLFEPSFARIISAEATLSKTGLAAANLCCPLSGNQIFSRRIIRHYNAGDVSLNDL